VSGACSEHSLSSFALRAVEAQTRVQTNNQTKDDNMTPNTRQIQTSAAREGGRTKQSQGPAASEFSIKPVRKETAAPSEPEIAEKAYEIWLSQGQETGQDQKHWFEAERQLRNA
jgi:hypothetical protein